MRASPYALPLVASALVAVTFACVQHDHDNWREDVVACEEAVAHLASCCPGLEPHSLQCLHIHDVYEGCTSSSETKVDPMLDVGESNCILASTCSTLLES